MRKSKYTLSLLLVLVILSCNNKQIQPAAPEIPVTNITVDVSNVVRVLSGKEVGINLNYLMDDAVLSGNDYDKTAESLKQMGAKILRYPGGEKSDNYYFSSLPYRLAAPSTAFCTFPTTDARFYNPDQTAKSEVLDFDEFMSVCNKTQAQPLVVVAYDAMYSPWTCGPKPTKSQLLNNAVEWVRYANVTKGYGIKLWMIGNESYLETSYNGFTTASQYAKDVVEFADAMRGIDPSIKIIVNGKADWWPVLLNGPSASKIDYLAVSNYLPIQISSYETYRRYTGSLNTETDLAIAAINNAASVADKERIGVIESEYNSIDFANKTWPNRNNLGHALCSFEMLAESVSKPKLYTACLWTTRWIENTSGPQALNLYDAVKPNGQLNATGMSTGILGNHLLESMMTTISTGRVKCYATYAKDSKRLNLFILNRETSVQRVKISTSNFVSNYRFDRWEFTGTSPDDPAPSWAKIAENQTGTANADLTLPANSITMLVCKP